MVFFNEMFLKMVTKTETSSNHTEKTFAQTQCGFLLFIYTPRLCKYMMIKRGNCNIRRPEIAATPCLNNNNSWWTNGRYEDLKQCDSLSGCSSPPASSFTSLNSWLVHVSMETEIQLIDWKVNEINATMHAVLLASVFQEAFSQLHSVPRDTQTAFHCIFLFHTLSEVLIQLCHHSVWRPYVTVY